MDGILNIHKLAGKTSYGVVAAVKRMTGERHTGHAGTLDPEASGVLPICLGKATRIVEFLMDLHKVYRAVIELGITTDSYDGAGEITRRADAAHITRENVEKALEAFRGVIEQVPPMFSALKHQGQPLYNLAREGISVERRSRSVTIYRLDLLDWQPSPQTSLVTVEIECSKGTYIRSIANDLGEALGCGAYLKNLVRSAYGPLKIEEAVTLDDLGEAKRRGDWKNFLRPIDSVLDFMPSVTVDSAGEASIKTGSPPKIETPPETKANHIRAYSEDGRFLAILLKDKDYGVWRPKKVFA
jgi:tRNA pseudouridine55 synthase